MPGIGRFISADTIVPDPANPQSFNRYSYALNNPVKYNDPSGHCSGDPNDPNNPDSLCWTEQFSQEEYFQVQISGDWSLLELGILRLGMTDLVRGLGGLLYFHEAFGGTNLMRAVGPGQEPANVKSPWKITFWDGAFTQGFSGGRWLVSHEFGHIWDANSFLGASKSFESAIGASSDGCLVELGGNCNYAQGRFSAISIYSSNDRREDWAEHFAAAMYQGSWGLLGSQGNHGVTFVLTVDRSEFVYNEVSNFKAAVDNRQFLMNGGPEVTAQVWSPYTSP